MEFQIPGDQRFTVGGILGKGNRPVRVFNVFAEANGTTGCAIYLVNSGGATTSSANAYITLSIGTSNPYTFGNIVTGEADFHYGKRLPAGCCVVLSAGSGCTYATVTYHEEL